MKILMINKFLHPNGGSETYIFKLGEQLLSLGHQVEYFGMEHEGRVVGNSADEYTTDMDFHDASTLQKLTYPIKTIYSTESRRKLRKVLQTFKPDVCHINNFNYQLTPSIILEIVRWRKQSNRECRIIHTAHDYQLVCPNHMCRDVNTDTNCEKCLNGRFINCVKNKCIHGSTLKSLIGTVESSLWHSVKVYRYIDKIICCSYFLKSKLDTNELLRERTVAMHNFVEKSDVVTKTEKKDYVLYFGRYSTEKGVNMLIDVCRSLPHIKFVFAGTGPLEPQLLGVDNIENVGFKSGEQLKLLISEALFSICPSQCYENCPFSVMESQMYGTAVLGADIGGVPELIKDEVTGELFESGNIEQLKDKINSLYNDAQRLDTYTKNCEQVTFDTVEQYTEKLLKIYR